jgi:hypothetical protein
VLATIFFDDEDDFDYGRGLGERPRTPARAGANLARVPLTMPSRAKPGLRKSARTPW